ncbi:MAG: MFS transporter [Oceanobacter sp.]|jgi:PPP family 3-phenylpropionic acid transporter|nr:MAG: MFS transporter [Oceanobacter sp.]
MQASSSHFALFYALYFALLGCIAPFWGLYLQHLEFSASDIGLLMGMFGVVRILAPNIWAAQARHFNSTLHMIRLAGLLTVVSFTLIFVARDLVWVAVVMVAYGFFWAAMLPQYEALCMESLGNQLDRYSRVRLWGSLGFVITVGVLGAVFDQWGIVLLPVIMWILMVLITVNTWLVSQDKRPKEQVLGQASFLSLLTSKAVIGFIVVNIFLQISFGPYYTFFSIFLESAGYSASLIGVFWAIGVIAEVILFWQFGRIMHLMSWRTWIAVSLIVTGIRWALTGYLLHSVWTLILLQTLHAFSFAAMHAVSMRYIQSLFPGSLQARGQALYSSVSFGLGGAIGAFASGLLWESLGGTLVFLLAGIVSMLAAVIAIYTLDNEKTAQ